MDKWGRRFGFVKFKEVVEVDVLSKKLEDVWWDKFKLRVNRERFGKGEKKEEVSADHNRPNTVRSDLLVKDALSF
jgi:hypothetical protein